MKSDKEDTIWENYVNFSDTQHQCKEMFTIIDFTKHLCCLIDNDFETFCNRYSQHVICHSERYSEACVFKFDIVEGYTLYIATENGRAKSFQIENEDINRGLCQMSKKG